jgi:hypothetical protein
MSHFSPLFTLLSCLILLTSCRQNESTSVTDYPYPAVAELQQIATLNSATDEIFARPNMVLPLHSEKFIIADTQLLKLHLFDENLNHIHTFGREGQGPGEFQRFSEITIDDNLIRVYDGRAYKVIELAVGENEIEFIGESDFTFFPLPDFPGAMFWRFFEGPDDTHLALYRDFNIQTEASPRFTRIVAIKYNDDYSPADEEPALVFDYIAELDFRNGILSIPYYQRGFVAHSNGQLYYAKNDTPEIRAYDTSGEQIQLIALPDTRVPLTRDDKAAAYDQMYRNSPDPELFKNEVMPEIPDNRPVIRSLTTDSQGRIWIRIYTDDDNDTDWLVLDNDGSPLKRLSLPDGHTFRNAFGNTLYTGFIGENGPEVVMHQWDLN